MKSTRKYLALAFAGVLTLAACGGSDGASTDSGMTELGAGEGAVNVVAWAGYVENGTTDPAVDWVTGFEKETGCKVNVNASR